MQMWIVVGVFALSAIFASPARGQIISSPPTNGPPIDQPKSQWSDHLPGSSELPPPLTSDSPDPIIIPPAPREPSGFRVLSVPEPGALVLTGLMIAWAAGGIRKARKRSAE